MGADDPRRGPASGTQLDGKFQLIGKLGEGGMSTVWKAENTFVRKRVAIKIMHPEYARNPKTLGRFRNEATAAGRIGNAHICDILDLGQSEFGPYIVMEMLRGEPLNGTVERMGRVPPGMAALILRQALMGLSAAHRVGIIHRDLKPENIFLHQPSPGHLIVKLMDFGISKFTEGSLGGKTGTNVLMGTPEYMSPEQAHGAADVDERTDIWAMGAILYRAVTGQDAFRGPTLAATLLNVTSKPYQPVLEVAPHVPPGMAAIIDRCLDKNLDQRLRSSEELRDMLEPFETGDISSILVPIEHSMDMTGSIAVIGKPQTAGDGLRPAPAPVPGAAPQAPPAPTPAPGASPSSSGTQISGPPPDPGAPSAAAPTPAPRPAPAGDASVYQSDFSAAPGDGSPTFVGGPPPSGGGNTWSTEIGDVDAGQSWTVGDVPEEHRERRRGGGIFWVFAVLAVLIVGGGVYWLLVHHDDPAAEGDETGDVVAQEGGEGEGEGEAEDGEAEAEEGAPAKADVAAAEGGAETGAEAGETDSAGTIGDPVGETAGGGEAGGEEAGGEESGSAEGGSGEGGSAEGGGAEGGGEGGSDTGEEPKPKPKVKVQTGKVHASGGRYTEKGSPPKGSWSSAKSYCQKLRRSKYAGLSGWRLGSASEANKFSGKISKTLYWTKKTSGSQAQTVNLFNGKTEMRSKTDKSPRAFCVSPRV